MVAPFISELLGLQVGSSSGFRHCGSCDLSFFDRRYSPEEMTLLYENYRGDDYIRIRRAWEPWYSKRANAINSIEGNHASNRTAFMEQILEQGHLRGPFQFAVDFGGDRGQFFPSSAAGRRLVCDLSSGPLFPGVERIASLDSLEGRKADLIIAAHVLEHLADPVAALREIREALRDDGVVYLEVPLDRFELRRFHGTGRYAQYLQRLSGRRLEFLMMDFVTGVCRQRQLPVPRWGVVKQSEHINYFSRQSIARLLASAGLEMVASKSDPRAKVGGLRIGRFGVAARPSAQATN